MHHRKTFLTVVTWLFLALFASLPAQEFAATGAVAGRIRNVVTDQYLNNARVTVTGTDIVTFTNEDGSYRLVGVPSGARQLEIAYTGLDTQRLSVEVPAGGTADLDVQLTSVSRYGTQDRTVTMDPYVVTADRELNSQNIATNEQRFASNIKNVLATDSFGSMMANSVGEFMKFIPGVTVGYSGNEITEFSVRGIGGAMSTVTQDGAPLVFGSYGSSSRIFNPYTSDINSTARIEVTKVPTPSMPADSIGGSINMVSKSVFDKAKAEGHYSVGFNVNGRYLDEGLTKSASMWGDKKDYKMQASGSFDYSLPINKNFGIFVSGLYFPKAGNNTNVRTLYQSGGTSTGASLSSPFMQNLFELDAPRVFSKTNGSIRADWRIAKYATVSFSYAGSENSTRIGGSVRNSDTGAVGTPTVVGGTSLTYGPDFTIGATGRGFVRLQGQYQEFNGATKTPAATFRFDDGHWRISSNLTHSRSYMEKDNPGGPFPGVVASLRVPVRVTFRDIVAGTEPGAMEVYDNNNQRVDINDIANYKIDSGSDVFYRNKAEVAYADLKVKRNLEMLPFPSSLEVGGSLTTKWYENRGWTKNYTYNGPDGNAATQDPIPDSFLYQVYRSEMTNEDAPPFLAMEHVWAAWRQNPNLFTQTAAQQVAAENNRRTIAGNIKETVTAAYIQGEARLFNGRLNVLTGVRFEETTDAGYGSLFDPNAVFVRNADGSFARDGAGARIRRADAGAVGSMEELNLTTVERGAYAERTYDGYYPSMHLTYHLRENLLLRAAYAKTFGRPDYLQIIPGTTIREADLTSDQMNDPTISGGILNVRNTGLKPWTGDNYDLSLEYYTPTGGVITAGVFLKELEDFFGSSARLATQEDLDILGLDSRYLGWTVTSTFNAGNARISGVEFSVRQSLANFGGWGKYFTAFANATRLRLEGNRLADFSSFIPVSANWGVSFARKRLYTGVKWNYRGLAGAHPMRPLGRTVSRTSCRPPPWMSISATASHPASASRSAPST